MTLFATPVSLQHIHPMVVHFPIALCLTALFLDVCCLVFRRYLWLDRSAVTLGLMGMAGLVAAYLTGDRAAVAAAPIGGIAQGVLADHEDLALLTLISWGITIVLRLLVAWLGRRDRQIQLGIYRLAALVVAVGAATLLVMTAVHGGALVYDHGVGVGVAASPSP
jgi:uncharacterized membrane protein